MMLKADGDRLHGDGISPKDYVVVRVQPTVDNYDIAVAILDEEATMKKVVRMPGQKIMLMSENSKYAPIIVEADEVQNAGKVVEILQLGFKDVFE